jgi:ComF family protein
MVEQMFWGRTKIENATAFYYYTKGSRVQQIIYHLKYKNQKEIGYELGKEFAYSLKGTPYEQTDLIAAVPLHIVKYKKRGYNQSYWIAKGLAEILKKPVEVNNITRKIDSFTQTHKSRYERWENLSDGFFVRNVEPFRNKHILLIDDVITTGATLEACVNTLLSIPGTRISIAVLAIATN